MAADTFRLIDRWYDDRDDRENLRDPITILRDLIATVAEEAHAKGYKSGRRHSRQDDQAEKWPACHPDCKEYDRGKQEAAWVTCDRCGGDRGQLAEVVCGDGESYPDSWEPCPDCGGTGKVSRERVAELGLAEWLVDLHDRDPSNARGLRMVLARGESDRREAERRKAREYTP